MCRRAGINVHPGTPREWLIGYLEGEYEPQQLSEADHPIDRWRHGIISFLSDYWDRVHPQLNSECPARNLRIANPEQQDDRPCFKCPDQKVMTCVAHNAHNEARIRMYLPKRTKE